MTSSASLPFSTGIILFLAITFPARAEVSDDQLAPLKQWLEFQRGIRSVEADFVQSRELRTLRNPLRSSGKVWIDRKEKRFRWQTGDENSPRSVAVKTGDTLTLLQPSQKRGKRIDLADAKRSGGGNHPEAAFDFATGELPDNLADLREAFSIESIEGENGAWRVVLLPLEARLRESLDEVVFLIDGERHFLRGFEMTFRDGSVVKTTFTRQAFNVSLEDSLFEPDLGGYQFPEP